jgi:hypothetical protein
VRDGGGADRVIHSQIDETLAALEQHDGAAFDAMYRRLAAGRAARANAVDFVLENATQVPNAVFAGSVAYLKIAGIVLSG